MDRRVAMIPNSRNGVNDFGPYHAISILHNLSVFAVVVSFHADLFLLIGFAMPHAYWALSGLLLRLLTDCRFQPATVLVANVWILVESTPGKAPPPHF